MTAVLEVPEQMSHARLSACIKAGRKDELVIDFARLCAAHWAKMVEHVSLNEGRAVNVHGDQALHLEALDIVARRLYAPGRPRRGALTEDPRDPIRHLLEPWHQALELDDPSLYRMPRMGECPVYVGREEDALCLLLSMCVSVDVQPVGLRWGIESGRAVRVWGVAQVGEDLYDIDPNDARLRLGEHLEFPEYETLEVPI